MDNSVFISYRRNVSGYPARAVFQALRFSGIDAFMDVESIDSGQFDSIILGQIEARPYFLLLLAPGCLERCAEAGDWLRREIEHAISTNRVIIPLLTSAFDFNANYAKPYLTGKLAKLPTFNALNVPLDYFDEAMNRLRTRFLKPIDLISTPTPKHDQAVVQRKIAQAESEPQVTETQLSAQEYFEQALARPEDDLDTKIADYDEALRLNPRYADALINRGNSLANKGNPKGAIADYNEVLRLNPLDADAYYNRGNTRYNQNDLEGAIADYTKSIEYKNPQLFYPYNNRGLARAAQGDPDGAIADYNEAISLNPQLGAAFYNRGLVRSSQGDLEGAIADYDEVLRLDPQSVAGYYNRGDALKATGDLQGACADYHEALRLNTIASRAKALLKAIAETCRD